MAPWLAGTVRVPHPNCMQHAMGVMDIMIQPQPCQRRSTRHGVWNGAIASVCDKRMSMADLSILDARWGEYTHTYIGSRMHMHVYMPEGSSIYPMQPWQTYRASEIQLLKVVWCSLFQTVNAGCVVVVMLYPLSHIICLACKGRSAKDSECSIHTYNVFQVDVHGGMGPVDSTMEMSQTHAYRCIDLFF